MLGSDFLPKTGAGKRPLPCSGFPPVPGLLVVETSSTHPRYVAVHPRALRFTSRATQIVRLLSSPVLT